MKIQYNTKLSTLCYYIKTKLQNTALTSTSLILHIFHKQPKLLESWSPGSTQGVWVELCRFIVVQLKHKVSHFYFCFCQKVERGTYFVYFHTFSYKFKV